MKEEEKARCRESQEAYLSEKKPGVSKGPVSDVRRGTVNSLGLFSENTEEEKGMESGRRIKQRGRWISIPGPYRRGRILPK